MLPPARADRQSGANCAQRPRGAVLPAVRAVRAGRVRDAGGPRGPRRAGGGGGPRVRLLQGARTRRTGQLGALAPDDARRRRALKSAAPRTRNSAQVRIAALSGVTKDITAPGDYGGFPAAPAAAEWRRAVAAGRRGRRERDDARIAAEHMSTHVRWCSGAVVLRSEIVHIYKGEAAIQPALALYDYFYYLQERPSPRSFCVWWCARLVEPLSCAHPRPQEQVRCVRRCPD